MHSISSPFSSLTRALAVVVALLLWSSSAHAQDVCWRQSQGRGVGTIPTSCAAGQVNDAGLCYDSCKTGYRDGGPMCWQACPAGKTELGPVCSKGLLESCSNGMIDLGFTCGRRSYGRGVGTIPTTCAAGEEFDAGLCYAKCSGGRVGVGPVCWQNSCPADFPVSCGMGCSTSTKACVSSVFRQTSSTLEVFQNVLGAGRILNHARKTAKYVGREAARQYIKNELEKAASRKGKKLAADLLAESSAFILGELDDGSGQFDIASLDPTGIATVIQAFDNPICGEGSPSATGPTLAQLTMKKGSSSRKGDASQPITDTPVYVTTDNAPGMCLSVDAAGKAPVMRPCAVKERLTFERVRAIKSQRVYQIRHPDRRRCLYSNADGRFAFYKCVDGANDQRWYTAHADKPDRFLLLNGNSGKCLFLNKKKLGVYTCNTTFDDQHWRTQPAPKPPTDEPVDIFTYASAECVGASSGSAKPGACSASSRHVIALAGKIEGQRTYELRDMAKGTCLNDARGKLAYGACGASARWYTVPTSQRGVQLVHASSGRCLFSAPGGRHGTAECDQSRGDQIVVVKRTTTPAEALKPRTSSPSRGEWVRLSTANAPEICLTASGKKTLASSRCDYPTGFDAEHVREVPAAYTLQLRHRTTGLCLTSREGKPVRYEACEKHARQWWVVKPRKHKRGFALKSAETKRCLFMNEKKAGTYKCGEEFDDQSWRVMQ